MRTVCVEAEQNQTWLKGLLIIREYKNFLEEDKLVVGGASVACNISGFWHHAGILQDQGC